MATIDELTRGKLVGLYPVFAEKAKSIILACQARGLEYYATSGLRTVDEQNALYAQGRTKPGNIVTNARGGSSFHNFGIALDACADANMQRAGLQPDWNEKSYKILGEEVAKDPSLTWGGTFKSIKDFPHFELNIGRHNLTLKALRDIYAKGGYPAVFKALDAIKW